MAQTPTTKTTVSVVQKKFPFDIYITPECLIKLNEYARAALPTEIGGLARLEIDKENKNIFVIDVEMLEQTAQTAYFQIEPDAMNKWMIRMIKEGRQDEIQEWRSIVHSHPVGHSANMSGVDIDEIKSFAAEQDAFSLIIVADPNAGSKTMLMHYCMNLFGEKHVIESIPVKVSIPASRLEMLPQIVKYLRGKLGGSNAINENDLAVLEHLAEEFLVEKLPVMFGEERQQLRDSIEEHVKQILVRETYVYRGQSKPKTGYTQTIGENDDTKDLDDREYEQYWRNQAAREYLREADEERRGEAEWAALRADEQEFLGYGVDAGYDDTNTMSNWRKSQQMQTAQEGIFYLYSIGFDKYDPKKPSEPVSNRRAKKARRMWENRVSKLNEQLRAEYGVGLYDMVVVDYSKVASKPQQINTDLANTPHEISGFTNGTGGCCFELAGELFWSHELTLVSTFEKQMSLAREKKAAENRTNRVKLDGAAKDLEEVINETPKSGSASLALVKGSK